MSLPCLGIDIAKVKFNVCLLLFTGKLKHRVFPNTAAGFALLQQWLEKHSVPLVHACLEATGTYGEALSHYLHDRKNVVLRHFLEYCRSKPEPVWVCTVRDAAAMLTDEHPAAVTAGELVA